MQYKRRRKEEVNTAVRAGAWRAIYKIKDSELKGTLGARLHDLGPSILQRGEGAGKFK